MVKIILLNVFLFSVNVFAEEYMVTGDKVNFRSSANFRGGNNIIKTLSEGDRLVLKKDHGDYIEGTLVPEGTLGFVWKDYVQLSNTHDYYKSTSNTFPTVTPDTEDPNISTNASFGSPMCACSACVRTSGYGIRTHPKTKRRKFHEGCDISAPKGTNVYAVSDGKVKFAGSNDGYGNTVDIEHLSMLKGKDGKVLSNRGYTTRYAHLWKIHVAKGATVKKGQRIGQVNSTGVSTGNHLHFEVAVTGTVIDPEKIIEVSDTKKACSSADTGGTQTTQ